mgnify:CR=1 FL=1
MIRKIAIIISIFLVINNLNAQENKNLYLVKTSKGNMKIKLYDKTPLHRDNFKKLVEQNYYDSLLFHRVINHFMIQGGDPDSKNAGPGERLGNGGPGYTIEAEFHPDLIHKKGVIAAAREGDQVNPEKRSSGSQFYIVHGKVFTKEELEKLEKRISFEKMKNPLMDYVKSNQDSAITSKYDSLMAVQDFEKLNQMMMDLQKSLIEQGILKEFKFSEKQREIYTTLGGTPHLDGSYTVFGELIEGIETLEKIAGSETDRYDRPKQDIRMYIEKIE